MAKSVADQLEEIGRLQTQGFSWDEAAEKVSKGAEFVGSLVDSFGGGSGGSSGGGQTETSRQGLESNCSVAQVASEISLGLRNPDGSLTAKGREQGAPENCPPSILQQGIAEYQRKEGSGSSSSQPSPPPAPNRSAESAGSRAPAQIEGLPAIPDEAQRNLPAGFDIQLPDGWTGWLGALGRLLVGKLGQEGAQSAWSVLGALLGRRVSEYSVDSKKVPLLLNELPDWMRKPLEQWQAGFDAPIGCTKKQENLFLALIVATSSYDIKTDTVSKCMR